MRKSRVDVIYDKRKKVAKCGTGMAEFRLYLTRGVRKYIPIAEITPAQWEHFTDSIVLQEQLEKYDQILSTIEFLGKPLTYETLNEALGIEEKDGLEAVKQDVKEQITSREGSFILFFFDDLTSERIEPRTRQAREVVYNSLLAYGRIAEIRFWNCALNSSQAQQLGKAGE